MAFSFHRFLRFISFSVTAALFVSSSAVAQSLSIPQNPDTDLRASSNVVQVANILNISDLIEKLRIIRSQTACGASTSVEELAIRQDMLESIEGASLDVDGVLAELENERARLFELRAVLASRRDHSLGLLNIANLVTGTGLGVATNALQFSDSTAKIGDNIGVISGLGSTALSVLAIRRQHGPQRSVGRLPNMLAPLFGREAKLNTDYPSPVLAYLKSVPAGQAPGDGSRVDQLMTEWRQAGRLGPAGSKKTDQQVVRLTSSLDTRTKLSIDDISDRIAMLSDVSGRVSLMKRDLSQLMKSVQRQRLANCR